MVDMRDDAEISDIFCFQVAFPDEILSRIVPKFHLKTGKWANGVMEFMRRNLYGNFRRIGILRNEILKDKGKCGRL